MNPSHNYIETKNEDGKEKKEEKLIGGPGYVYDDDDETAFFVEGEVKDHQFIPEGSNTESQPPSSVRTAIVRSIA